MTFTFTICFLAELMRSVSVAAAHVCKVINQTGRDEDVAGQAKLLARCLSGQLSPAIYQLLSDGLLPNVNTFFGQVINSVWRVVEASVKKGSFFFLLNSVDFFYVFVFFPNFLAPMLPWIEELVLCLNSEESLPEGPVRFGVFITELVKYVTFHEARLRPCVM